MLQRGFQGLSSQVLDAILAIQTVSFPHVTHLRVRRSKPGLSGEMCVTTMSLPHVGHLAIGCRFWLIEPDWLMRPS
jgi:hypothetical protein